ncbi:phage tail tape measure protein [Lactobacillus crispatus]|uniref:phage tail tip lysozyme n=1 Tax=Lactobacillus crispatus TaxID=47770 RepID=UPI000B5DAFDF|nr:phage tail tip lysozyme [Lactobacillus crispatus]OXC13557.1 phage tail tape measure protein [Lactobacillus crispatus]
MLDAHGNLKGLSQDMSVLYKHIEEHSKGGSDKNGFFKSIFGTSGMNGAMILAKSSKEVEDLTKRTEKAGKTGSYVAKLAAQNMGTAQGSAASAKQAMNAFKMTLGNALLPAINQASNALAKFLLSKDGKKFQKDVGGAVAKVANGLVKLIKWTATHKREVKWIGYGILAGYSISKGLKFISFLGQVKKGLEAIKAIKFVGGLFGKVTGGEKAAGTITKLGGALPKGRGGAGILTGALQSAKSAGGFKKLSTAGKLANGAAGVGVALDAGSQFVNAYKDRHNADKRSQDIGQGIGSAIGGGIGMYFGGPLGAAVGSQLGKVAGKWGGTAVNNFTKGWQKHKPPKNFWSMENLGWSTHNMFKNLPSALNKTGKRIKSWASGVGRNIHKGWDKGMKVSHSFFKNLPKNMSQTGKALQRGWNQTWKKVNNNRYVKAFKQGEFIQTASKDIQSRWKSFSTDFGKKWNAGWKSFNNARYVKAFKKGEFFSTALKDIQSRWKSFSTDFGKKWNDFWDRLSKGWNNFWGKAGDIRKGITNNIKGFANSIAYGSGHSKHTFKYEKIKSHANGGAMHSTHGALVGEAGPELAYKPYASHVRLLGANGPQFTKVHAGEHILNARDTAKVLNGGLGNGLTLKGYANGTDKLGKTSKKVTNDYKQIADKSSKSLNSLSKKSSSTWNKITRQTGKDSSKTRKRAISDYSDMHKGIVKQMDKTHDGVISLSESTAKGFGKALGKTKGYARDAMSDSIGEINKGITGIDKVLGQFGGNTSVIKPVKFATGTDANGRLTENTLAMVNDAQTGPRQEALVSDKNELFLPRGNNITMMLPKGWGVLNGTQTQQVAKSAGVKHFAKGSGLSHSALRKLAEKAGANPAQSFKEMYLDKLKPSGSNLKRGSIGLAQNSSQHFGNPWSNAMWTVINDAIGGANGKGGTREAFLKYAERTFSGVPYQMGAASKKLSDCSGMVSQALEHFGINIGRTTVAMQSNSGVQYLGKSLSKTIPGDLVIFGHGTGAAGHVGIIKNPHTGTMFNETPPHARVTSIADDKGMGYGYYRVRGLHNASQSKKQAVADKRLISLAKQELGHHAISWIKKNLSDDLGSLGSFSIGGDLAQRAKALAAGLRKLDPNATKNGIAAILGNWNFESGGLNPGAVNPGGGASGLGQWLGGRKANLIAYARRHGTSWKNAGTQLSFAVKGEGSDSAILRSILEGSGSVASLANKFSAEWERGGYNAQHVRGAMEIRKALGYAKGGRPKAHTPFIAGERGPELITADGPVKVDSHEQTKRKVSDLAQMFKFPKINRPTRSNSSAPVININFNGPIYGTKEEAKRIAELVRREINKVLVNIGDEFGTDPSLY